MNTVFVSKITQQTSTRFIELILFYNCSYSYTKHLLGTNDLFVFYVNIINLPIFVFDEDNFSSERSLYSVTLLKLWGCAGGRCSLSIFYYFMRPLIFVGRGDEANRTFLKFKTKFTSIILKSFDFISFIGCCVDHGSWRVRFRL